MPILDAGRPRATLMIPSWFLWLLRTGKLKFQHISIFATYILCCAMPRIKVNERHRPRRTAKCPRFFPSFFGIHIANGFVHLHPGQHPRRPHILGRVLGKIKSEHPVKSRMPYIVIVHITILVPLLSAAPGRIQVAMSMGVQNVIGSQQTRQGALHRRVFKHAPDQRNPRQNIIAGIAFCCKRPPQSDREYRREMRVDNPPAQSDIHRR